MSIQTDDIGSLAQIASDIIRELQEHPERWIQHHLVRLVDGSTSNYYEALGREDAVAWCIEGHIMRRRGPYGPGSVLREFQDALEIPSLWSWNDQPGRTVQEVIDMLSIVASAGQNSKHGDDPALRGINTHSEPDAATPVNRQPELCQQAREEGGLSSIYASFLGQPRAK